MQKERTTKHTQLTIPFGDDFATYRKPEPTKKPRKAKSAKTSTTIKSTTRKTTKKTVAPATIPQNDTEKYLCKNYRFRYNTVLERTEFKRPRQQKFKPLSSFDQNSIKRNLNNAGHKISKPGLQELLESDFVPTADPFKSYLEGIEQKHQPDRIDHIKSLVKTITFSQDPAQNKAMQKEFYPYFRKWMIAFVASMYQDGIYNENALIFVSGQGVGKTKWLLKLFSQTGLQDYLHQGLLKKMDKDTLLKISQNGLVLMDELHTLKSHEATCLKAILSQKTIKVTKPFHRHDGNYDRKASFVGTSNQKEILVDQTGNRRYLIFEVQKLNHKHRINMNKVFTQAFRLFKRGERYWFNEQETALIEERNKQFTASSHTETLLQKYFALPQDGMPKEKFVQMNTSQIIEYINKRETINGGKGTFDAADKTKVGKTLRKLGYKQTTFRPQGGPYPIKGYLLSPKEVG